MDNCPDQSLGGARCADAYTGFRVAAAVTTQRDTPTAFEDILAQLAYDRADPPDFVTLHYGAARPAQAVWDSAMNAFGDTALHGGSSCLGVMSEAGAAIESGDAIGVFAIWDGDGAYGTGACPLGQSPRKAAAIATRAALRQADRMGEAPELVWLTAAPGHEEAVLQGIKDVVGAPALIVGGSSADNDVSGKWSQFTAKGAHPEAVVVSVLFPSVPIDCSFESGYAPTEQRGTITRADGRSVHSIDGRPAAEVYAEWTKGSVPVPAQGSTSILAQSTLFPLGRRLTQVDGIDFHILAHPAVGHADGRLDLFADLQEGQTVWLMTGSQDSLVERAGRTASKSYRQLPEGVSGALMIYCGGCMLSVTQRMNEVAAQVAEGLGQAPFLGIFSFGEQGEALSGGAEHGNLMISCITFGAALDPDQGSRPADPAYD
jgi:hypothetical protein